MRIKKTIETENGAVEIHADLNPDQVQFLLEVGLNVVMAKGVRPFIAPGEKEPHDLHQRNDTVQ